ncbi:hypothetical protein [Bogoriella caseilytica]|uniref:Uncharacterized protein n=1 Tax=Bogoriella caseilytica TaxID=56055 RepID=A0A3N2BAC3_9MICO|nr:hypothetical protein [Bogoriella caseilytica]ROR72230.1 hypothetical protein EDD31_0579 [Bogoriella caseilytica]
MGATAGGEAARVERRWGWGSLAPVLVAGGLFVALFRIDNVPVAERIGEAIGLPALVLVVVGLALAIGGWLLGWSYRGRHRLATLAVWLPMPLVALVLLVLLMTAFGS